MLVEEHLRGKVFCGAAEGVGELVGAEVGLGQAKIAERDVTCRVEEDIFWLEIAEEST